MTALPSTWSRPKRTADGWPDLQGTCSQAHAAGAQHSLELDAILVPDDRGPGSKASITGVLVDPMRGMIPYQPWAQAKRLEKLAGIYAPAKIGRRSTTLCFQLVSAEWLSPSRPGSGISLEG